MDNKIDAHSVDHASSTEKDHKDSSDAVQAETFEKREQTARGIFDFEGEQTLSGKFENPLAGIPKHKLFEDVRHGSILVRLMGATANTHGAGRSVLP